MFFLFRAVFWLTIVFTSIPLGSDNGLRALGEAAARQSRTIIGSAKEAAASRATAYCVEKPTQCLAEAARLTALIDARRSEGSETATFKSVVAFQPATDTVYPVPRADPRRYERASPSPRT